MYSVVIDYGVVDLKFACVSVSIIISLSSNILTELFAARSSICITAFCYFFFSWCATLLNVRSAFVLDMLVVVGLVTRFMNRVYVVETSLISYSFAPPSE